MRPHPLYIFYNIKRWIFLLAIPLVRLLSTAPISPALFIFVTLRDLIVGAGLIAISVAKWRRTEYDVHRTLQIRQGIVIRRCRTLSPDSTAMIATELSPLMRLFRCRRIQISTAGRRRQTDATLYVSKQNASAWIKHEVGTEGYHARPVPVLIMAISGSNAAVGALTLVPFIRHAATVLGESWAQEWYSLTARFVVLGLPPVLENIANLLLLGWGVAVTSSLLRTWGFRVHRHNGRLHILSGVFTKRSLQIDSKCIASLLLRQTLFTRLLGLYTATISCSGYGRETGVRPVLIPAATRRDLCHALDQLLPQFPLCRVMLHPSKRALPRYILPPLGVLVAAGGLYVWSDAITVFPTLVVLIAGGWWFTVRLVGFFHAGFGILNGAVVMRYTRGFALYELQVPLASVDGILYRQGPFQKRNDTCHVFLLCFGEKQRRHRLFGMDQTALKRLLAQ